MIDRTGLTGSFDVQMTFWPEDFERLFGVGSAASDPNMPSLFTAVEEQLGLRLRATRGHVPTVVVDSVEMRLRSSSKLDTSTPKGVYA